MKLIVVAALSASTLVVPVLTANPADAATVDWNALQTVLTRATSTTTSAPTATPSDNVPDGPLMGNGHLTAVVGGSAAAQTYYVSSTDFWSDKVPRIIGGVTVSIPSLASVTAYKQEQDIRNAEVRSTFTTSTAQVVERSWVSANEDTMVLSLTNSSSATASPAITVSTYAGSTVSLPTTAGLTSGNTMWATRSSNGSTWLANAALASRVLDGSSVTYSTDSSTKASAAFTLAPGQTVHIVTALGDSAGNVSGSPWPAPASMSTELAAAQTRAGQLNVTSGNSNSVLDADALHTAHLAWWKNFWMTGATIDLGGGAIERYWYTSLYAMAASNRTGRSAPGMPNFLTDDTPVWGGNWTNDYNFEMPYQGLYAANHIELTDPYERGVLDCLPQSKTIATAAGSQGAIYGNNMMTGGQGCDFVTDGMKGNAAWLATNFVNHWNYTHDTAWAASTGYPFLIEVANFWDHDLSKDSSGVYNITNSAQNEWSSYVLNPIGDMSWLHYMYPALVQMSTALGVDSSRRALWQDINTNLAPYPTFTNIGHTDFKATQDAPGFYGGDANPVNAVNPGNNIDLGSSAALVTTAQNTVEDLNVWCQGNSFAWIFPAAARVGLPETYKKFSSYLGGGCGSSQVGLRGNSTVAQWGGGAETFGGMETVNSMLLTSATNSIRLFPDWPHGKNASFTNMLASGGFSVTSSLASGVVGTTSLTSNTGADAHVASPWAAGTISVTDTTTGSTVSTTTGTRNVVSFATTAGHTYQLTGTGSHDYTRLNLSGMGTASASSTHTGDGWSVPSLNDGVEASTSASAGWSSGDSGTSSNHTEWAQIDLGSSQLIGAVDLYPRSDSGNVGQGFPVDFTIAVSNDASTWTTVVTKTGYALPSGVQSFPFTTKSARYVRVTGTSLRANASDGGQYRMQLAEMKIFGPTDLALDATPTASSSHEGDSWSVANVNDKGLATGWSSGDSGVASSHTEWVQLDEGAATTISEVDLYPRLDTGNGGAGFPVNFTIAVSNDASTWTTVSTQTGYAQPTVVQPFTFTATSARYVRITGTTLRANANDSGNYRMQFAEVALR
ncbi:discoidin domain-containing protein [Streptomyces sp. NPDC101776]|uniref:discoidin domain-containing protein n=1 Tax=Streptomyces sp. NPDC101776 TaxID=3366146 RepID=UPI00382F9A4D